MIRKTFAVRLAGLAVVLGFICPTAVAAEPGDGLRAGNLALHPRLTLAGAYDTNVYRLAEDELDPNEQIEAAPIVSIMPGLGIETVQPRDFKFDFDGELRWDQYLSSNESVQGQSGLSGNVSGAGTINPNGGVSFQIRDDLTHLNQPPKFTLNDAYNRLVNRAGAKLGIHPGDRILDIGIAYDYAIYRYFGQQSLLDLDKDEHQFNLDVVWKFLPKTAFVVQGDYDIVNYEHPVRGVSGAGLPNVDSSPLHAKAGLSGLLTNKISVRLLGGYAAGMYDQDPTYSGFVGEAVVAYKFGQRKLDNDLSAGYERSFNDASIGNYFSYHRAFLNFRQNFFDRKLGLHARGEYLNRDYATLPGEVVSIDGRDFRTVKNAKGQRVFLPDDMHDEIVSAGAGIHTDLGLWSASLTYDYTQNFTNDQVDIPTVGVTQLREFSRHLVTLSTTLKY